MNNKFTEGLKNFFKSELAVLWLISLAINLVLLVSWMKNLLPLHSGDFTFFSLLTLLIALYRPRWVFFIFLGSISLENIIFSNSILSLQIRPYQFLGAILTIAIIILFFSKRLKFILLKPTFLDLFVFTLPIFSFFAVFSAPNKILSAKQDIILSSFVILYYITRNFIRSKTDLIKSTAFITISFITVATFGIYQTLADKIGKNSFEIMFGRPNSTFTEPDWFGIYLCFALAIFLSAVYFISSCKEINQRVKRFVLFVSYFFIFWNFILLILTLSRSAWIGSAVILFFYLLFNLFEKNKDEIIFTGKKFLFQFFIILMLSLISLIAIQFGKLSKFDIFDRARSAATNEQKITIACNPGSQIPQSVTKIDDLPDYGCQFINLEDIDANKAQGKTVTQIFRFDPNVKTRSDIYRDSFSIIKTSPILGVGYGTITEMLGKDQRGAGLNESNIFLQIWAGSGILGLLSSIFLFGYLFLYALRRISPICPINKIIGCPIIKDDFEKTLYLFSFLGLLALIIPNLFNAGLFMGIFWLGIALFAGIINIASSN